METVAGWAAGGIATAVVLALVVLGPRRGVRRYQALLAALPSDPGAKLRHYRSGIRAAWASTAAVGLVALLATAGGHEIGLPGAPSGGSPTATIVAVELIVGVGLSAVLLRARVRRLERVVRRQISIVRALVPVTRDERRWWVLVSLTAGICEELVFRWFGLEYVAWVAPGAPAVVGVVLTGAAFGAMHLYQGRWGVLGTGVLGCLLGYITVQSGSVLPAIVVHVLLDLRILAIPVDWLHGPSTPGDGPGIAAPSSEAGRGLPGEDQS